jgi:hypothetical protein
MSGSGFPSPRLKVTIVAAPLALVLGYATVRSIGALQGLPYSSFRVRAVDTLLLPGYLIAAVICPGGIHGTPTAAHYWPYVGLWGNVLWYAAVWFLAGWLLGRRVIRA